MLVCDPGSLIEGRPPSTIRLIAFRSQPRSPRIVLCVFIPGLTQLLENQDGSDKHITFSDASDELVKALEIAVAREDQQRSNPERGVTQCLSRCLVATSRARLRHDRRQQPTCGGGGGGTTAGAGLGVMAMLLSLNRGQLYPALAHETTCFVSRFDADRREVIGVVGPLASALLLQPECERDYVRVSLRPYGCSTQQSR